ncbi:MAG: pyridoxamine 5'-phosphate oxidase [Alphaproteobacteria bacterium CG11_big_fil_rev_8_21_14_0_20_39_49]|nr:MAG: pyridoxamine 5'-phosphate oxidase [Alphaproteobacteria bacterium CG11_big_fil_rev_8_21_14_0_20_39_49]
MTNKENPFEHFDKWFKEAKNHKDVVEPEAMNIATATKEGIPTNRMVLLKDYDEKGFVFYTNLESRKGEQLKENPKASLCFYWEAMGRQVRIEGDVVPVSNEEADAYFNSRALKSRIGAWASMQSRPLGSRSELIKKVAEYGAKTVKGKVERPPFWSGFRVIPNRMEFWQKGEYRIHDRTCYILKNGQWESGLLYP